MTDDHRFKVRATAKVEFPGDRVPRRDHVMLFKVGERQHMEQMRAGLLYMNSAHYFATLEEASGSLLRADSFESVYSRHRAGVREGAVRRLELQIGDGPHAVTRDLGDRAVMTVGLPNPKNTLNFSMSAFVLDAAGNIEGEWQREFRVCLCAKSDALNTHGALELHVADLTDITTLMPTRALVDEPFSIRKRWFARFEAGYEQVDRNGSKLKV